MTCALITPQVHARFGGDKKYYPGTIHAVNPDGSYAIAYDDGDFEEHVLTKYIRLPDSDVYSAERIINHRWVRGKIEYRVRWCAASTRPQHRQPRWRDLKSLRSWP